MALLTKAFFTAVVAGSAESIPQWIGPINEGLVPTASQLSASSAATRAASLTAPAEDACATVASLAAQQTSNFPRISAQAAWDCLQTVPLDATSGTQWLDAMGPYLEWQTTMAYLKNPPEDYTRPAIDILGGLGSIASNMSSFANEYELEWSIYQLIASAYDGHFRYAPTLVGGVVNWGRPVALVSLSSDGSELPEVYVYSDVITSTGGSFQASPVTEINGQDPSITLGRLNSLSFFQDPDAGYNTAFVNLAQISKGSTGAGAGMFAGGGTGALIYPGATTELTFANGSTATFENFANVLQDFSGIQTGQDVFDRFIVPATSTDDPAAPVATPVPVASPSSSAVSPPGYPIPVIKHPNNIISGYYLDTTAYDDVAVLSVPSFVSLSSDSQTFQDTAFDFIAEAQAAGKTKLIIDLSANGGGTVTQAHSLFNNLFPDVLPWGGTRLRAHEALDQMGELVSSVVGDSYPFDLSNPPPPGEVLVNFVGLPIISSSDLDANNEKFASWAQKFGPHEFQGDNFTSIIRFDLDDPLNVATAGITPNGHGDRAGLVTSRAFAPQNIVLLTDGYCASTCAVFAELMTQQGGVKTVAIGGQPFNRPMQAVGGTKGANVYPFSVASQTANVILTQLATTAQQASLSALSVYSSIPLDRATSASMNVRDNIRLGDLDQLPLQFLYEPADCRIFYEADMLLDVSRIWERVADVSWRAGGCVNGDIGLGAGVTVSKAVTSEGSGSSASTSTTTSWFGEGWFSFRLKSSSQTVLGGSGKKKATPELKDEDRKVLVNSWEVRTDVRDLEDNPGLMMPI